ncbi:MAG: nicotinate (nicotinamide) nucleotide adenylyltransferase [Ghiorsea sp.]
MTCLRQRVVKAALAALVAANNMPQRIAIFGGSFDPPHRGHQALVEAALLRFAWDELWLMPVGMPVHKQLSGKASAEQRCTWLRTMFAHDQRIKIMDWEVTSPSPTPAIDTLRRFKAENPRATPTWLMGMDSFLDLPNWVGYPEHQQRCNLLVFGRQGVTMQAVHSGWKLVDSNIQPPSAGHVSMLDVDLPDISASQIRLHPQRWQQQLPQSTCNAILACYAAPIQSNKREYKMTDNKPNTDSLNALTAEVIQAIEDKKGQEILTLDVTGRCSFADRFIIATGRTDRQLKALANAARQIGHSHDLTARVDGMDGMEWLVVDLGDVIVHFFLPEVRASFQLERLWSLPEGSATEQQSNDAIDDEGNSTAA